jgi:hypothetical protein
LARVRPQQNRQRQSHGRMVSEICRHFT